MSFKEDQWFEVWFEEGEDVGPSYLLIVKPDSTDHGKMVVIDPQEGYRIIHSGQSYEDTCIWLLEDAYSCVQGREFFYEEG